MPDVYDGRPLGGSTLSEPEQPTSEVQIGARIGGAILVANGLALLAEFALGVTTLQGGDATSGFRPSPVAMLIDLALGGMLVSGSAKGLTLAKIRAVLGLLILPILLVVQGESLLAGLQVAFSLGLILLLFGNAGAIRITTGLLATGGGLALETIGLLGIATGTQPLAHLTFQAEAAVAEVVQGQACPWQLTAASGHWHLRKAEAVAKDNPLADRWLVWPEKDAHVLVIAERLDVDGDVDMERFVEVVLANARGTAPDLKLLDRQMLQGGGVRLHTQGTYDGTPIETYHALFASEPWIFQVTAFSTQPRFDSVKDELSAIVASFQAPRL
jgi:hypothetical protein